MTPELIVRLAPTDVGNAAGVFLLLLVGGALAVGAYLLPTIIAALNKSHLLGPVAVLNILLGWTLLGWVGAMVLAFMPRSQPTTLIVNPLQQATQNPSEILSNDGYWRWDGRQWRGAQSTRSASTTKELSASTSTITTPGASEVQTGDVE